MAGHAGRIGATWGFLQGLAAGLLVVFTLMACAAEAGASGPSGRPTKANVAATTGTSTVWLCQPGTADDPCTASLTTTVVQASGASKVVSSQDDPSSPVDCFYVYPTVSKQKSTNANLKIQKPEIAAAVYEASRFSTVCNVWAPMYRQVTLAGLDASHDLDVPAAATTTAYDSLRSAFSDFVAHDNENRPIVFIGHSQGAAMLILLLKHFVDDNPALRDRTVMAIILGGNVEVKDGSDVGGSFSNLPICTRTGEAGCVIAYSSFPVTPPATSLFGRAGQGVSLQSDQTAKSGLQVACVNPGALSGGTAPLLSYFPPTSGITTPWVEYPNRYTAHCEHGDGATWLEVQKAPSRADHRPVVSVVSGPDWGYHPFDANLAMGNLVTDVAAAEATWSSQQSHSG